MNNYQVPETRTATTREHNMSEETANRYNWSELAQMAKQFTPEEMASFRELDDEVQDEPLDHGLAPSKARVRDILLPLDTVVTIREDGSGLDAKPCPGCGEGQLEVDYIVDHCEVRCSTCLTDPAVLLNLTADVLEDVPFIPPVAEPSAEERATQAMPIFDHPSEEVNKKAREKWARDEGYALADRVRAAKTSKVIPTPVSLTDFLAEPDEDAEYRIEGLWPVGGRVMLAAQMKAGKTTMVNNLLRSLADGDRFLETFEVGKVNRVTVIDNELDERMIRRWIRDQNIVNTGAIQLIPIRGNVSSFNILDPNIRAEWVKLVTGSDILILDCLRPVIDALGLSEDKDSGRVLVAFDALLKEAGIPEGAIVHHMGHSGERTRGDSRLRDWPDVSWKLVRQDESEDSPRFFSAYGRDVDVKEAQLAYDSDTRHLSFSGEGSRKETKKAAKADELIPHIVRVVSAYPGISGAEIERRLKDEGVPLQRGAIGPAAKQAEVRGHITRTEGGPGKPTYHYPVAK